MRALVRRLLTPQQRATLRGLLQRLFRAADTAPIESASLALKLHEERTRFADEVDISALPEIHVYWANRHLLPLLARFGFNNHFEFFAQAILAAPASDGVRRVLSLGSGNCDNEVRIAQLLDAAGQRNWTFHCIDLVPEMLERGRLLAAEQGVADRFSFEVADFNRWTPAQRFDLVMANQCLHHVVELEHLLDRVKAMLHPDGRFAVSDMIGRNGHQRWPEARAALDRFWDELPKDYRYHRQLKRQEDRFLDWDCSVYGFEGIRSQDILPLLCERFHFETFVAFGNIIDPLIDRGFGGNFNAEAEWDREFIDRVHAADVEGITSGAWTPTHLMAVCSPQPVPMKACWPDRGPQACIRRPG